jgi:hypothetical protein
MTYSLLNAFAQYRLRRCNTLHHRSGIQAPFAMIFIAQPAQMHRQAIDRTGNECGLVWPHVDHGLKVFGLW